MRSRLATGLPFSQRTRMRVQARIITKADELAMNFEWAYVFFGLISKNLLATRERIVEFSGVLWNHQQPIDNT